MPGFITAKALEPYKYTKGDISLNQEVSNIEAVSDQGTQLYNIRWTNYYLDISKPSHEILSLKASQSSGSLFGSHFAGGGLVNHLTVLRIMERIIYPRRSP